MRIRIPLVVAACAFLFAAVMRVLFWTLQLDVQTSKHAHPYAPSGEDRYIYSVWHDSIVIAAFGGKHVRTLALTSQHRDGTFVAHVLKAIGVPTVRGSTGHRGGDALRTILTAAKDYDIVMTPDGPRGPRREMSRGAIFLASRSGRAIVPTAFACRRRWTIRGSWTDLVIPKPFSQVFLLAGDPIPIPRELSRDRLAEYASTVQSAMDRLDDRVQGLVDGQRNG